MSRRYRLGLLRRTVNAVVTPLARIGWAGRRTHLLTVPGRETGRLYTTPVSLAWLAGDRFLVAPYGERNWVKNVRAAGWVELRRGSRRERLAVEEATPEQAVPVLRDYYRWAWVTRPFFEVTLDSPDEAWLAEAPRHPVFRLRGEPG